MGLTRLASVYSASACSAAEHLLYLGVALGINFFFPGHVGEVWIFSKSIELAE